MKRISFWLVGTVFFILLRVRRWQKKSSSSPRFPRSCLRPTRKLLKGNIRVSDRH